MRKYGKWLLVLGILAANPAWASADGFLSGLRSGAPLSRTAQKEQNQRKAEEVGYALKHAQLNGYDLEVEVRGDTVKLDGKVRDVTHRALAEQVCRKITGISRVQNNLRYVPSGGIQQTSGRVVDSAVRAATYQTFDDADQDIQQVHFTKPGKRQTASKPTASRPAQRFRRPTAARTQAPSSKAPAVAVPPVPAAPPAVEIAPLSAPKKAVTAIPAPASTEFATQATPAPVKPAPVTPAPVTPVTPAPAKPNNQEVAQNIANSLADVGLVGYDVEIRYDQGIATLKGDVANANQRQAAEFAASRVAGVNQVRNQLRVSSPIAQTGFAGPQNVHPASMTSLPPAMMAGAMQAGAPTAMASAGNFSNPQLPSHAWPAYAQYPNSAAIQYPTQYSASAFPYIGPFYPYPQVPMGWRETKLTWDDGYWQLDFEKKQDAWYWLFSPKNWK